LFCDCREEEAIKLDGLSVAQMRELRQKAEKFAFQAEVNRMMKLIINSLYKNKEVSRLKGLNPSC
jgi:heat shock protein beta